MDLSDVERRLRSAYGKLLQEDRVLLELDANERSITHKLAEYIQEEFVGWHVDCEYNRDGHRSKRVRLDHDIPPADTDAQTVYPDVIVHKRGTPNNLLVIEAKKSTTASVSMDRAKLRAYKSDLEYRFAFEVIFPVNDAAPGADARVDIIELKDE